MRYCCLIVVFTILAIVSGNDLTLATTGPVADDFTLNDIDGQRITLSEFRGKMVLLNFWATWCVPCRAEMPSLNNLYLALKDKGLVVLAISVDTSEKSVRSFIAEKKIAFPVLIDKDKEVYFDKYALFGLPVTILIKDGIIVEKVMGEREWDSQEMKEKIVKLLNRSR